MSAWDFAGGIVNGIGAIIGGKMNYDAQKKANETNLQIAQEYNQMQRDIVQQNNDLQYKMFQESNFYNSPENQRAMLVAAGYNPYSLYQNPSGGVAYSQSLPQLQQPQFAVPQVQPENAFGSAIQNAVASSAAVIKTLADANKTKSEKDLLDMQKQTYQSELIERLRGLGLDNLAKEYANEFAQRTMDDRVLSVGLDNAFKQTENSFRNQALRQAVFDYELAKTFGFKLKQAEFDKLKTSIALDNDQMLSNEVERLAKKFHVDYERAMIRIEDFRSQTERFNAKTARIQAMTGQEVGHAQAVNLQMQTGILRIDKALRAADAKLKAAAMRLGNDPVSNMIKRDIWSTSLSKENLRLAQDLLREQVKNAKTTNDQMKWRMVLDAADTAIRALEAAQRMSGSNNSTSRTVANYNKNGELQGYQEMREDISHMPLW